MPNWDQDNSGFVVFKPVVGWETALLAKTGCGLRVQFVHRTDDIGSEHQEAIQFALLPQQALELARDLTDMANRAQIVPPGTMRS